MQAVRARFGTLSLDICATKANKKAPLWYGPGSKHPDAFAMAGKFPTLRATWAWANIPFDSCARWAALINRESVRCRTLMLSPASVGADWFNEIVRPNAYVLELSPRMQFIGHDHGFPKDLILSVFTPERLTGRRYWRWKK